MRERSAEEKKNKREKLSWREEERDRDSERKEATIKMKNDILADIPVTVSLAPIGSYIPYPSGWANSLPTWNYWWFFKSVKQASRPQSTQGFPFPPRPSLFPSLFHLSFFQGIRRISLPHRCSFLQRSISGVVLPDRLAPCYLFFKLSTPLCFLYIRDDTRQTEALQEGPM